MLAEFFTSDNGPNDSRREGGVATGVSRRAGPATNVLLAPNVRDATTEDSSERRWPARDVGRYMRAEDERSSQRTSEFDPHDVLNSKGVCADAERRCRTYPTGQIEVHISGPANLPCEFSIWRPHVRHARLAVGDLPLYP